MHAPDINPPDPLLSEWLFLGDPWTELLLSLVVSGMFARRRMEPPKRELAGDPSAEGPRGEAGAPADIKGYYRI